MIEPSEDGFSISGIAPPDLKNYAADAAMLYWNWVAGIALKVKDNELARGLDAEGKPLRAIRPATRKHRKSAMTPSGKGDPTAPPLMPGRGLSRTRSLLTARPFPDHVELWWRFDPHTGDSWARVLEIQRDEWGRDVFGISPKGQARIQAQALELWARWKRGKIIPPMRLPQPALAATAAPGPARLPVGAGPGPAMMARLEAHYRAPAPPTKPGMRKGSVLLGHIYGQPEPPRGGMAAQRPPQPRPIVTQRAAMQPQPQRRLFSRIVGAARRFLGGE